MTDREHESLIRTSKDVVHRLRSLTDLIPGVTAIADEDLFAEAANLIESQQARIDALMLGGAGLPHMDTCGLKYDKDHCTCGLVNPVIHQRAESSAQWRCFHCSEVFTEEAAARAHFGETPASVTACQPGDEIVRDLLKKVRALNREVAQLRAAPETFRGGSFPEGK